MFTDCVVSVSWRLYISVEYDPYEASPPPQTCTLVVLAACNQDHLSRAWECKIVHLDQSASHCESGSNDLGVSFLSSHSPERWQDRGPRDPPHGEPSDPRGCKISLSLTLVFNISSLLGNTNRFKGNIQFGFHILAGIKQGRNCVMRLSRAAFFYLFCLHARRGAMWEILAHRFIIISKPTVPTKRLAGEFVQI